MRTAAVPALLTGLALAAGTAVASNTATSRSFTSEWQCENGRMLLINAHPTRPREEAWLTYAGKRVEVVLQATTKDAPQRFASKDGKVVWARLNDTSMLQFAGLTEQPLACSLKSTTQPNK
jgi:hypothetical protein